MSRAGALTRVALRSNFGLSLLRHRLLVQHKDIWVLPFVFLGALSLVPAMMAYVSLVRTLYGALKPMGHQGVILTLAVLAGQLVVLVFGLYYVLSTFYFSRDLETLIALPLKPWQVMASKFATILVNEYLIMALVVVPPFAAFGVLDRRGPGYWLLAALVFLLLPVIPLALAGLLVVVMMRFVNISRKKDFFILAGSLVILSVMLALQFGLARTRNPQDLIPLMTSPDGPVRLIGERFPPSVWASRLLAAGVHGRGALDFVLFVGGSALIFAALLWLSERLFYRGLIGLSERAAGKRGLSRAQVDARITAGRRPVRAILAREWKLMNRTPIFLLNGILSVVLIPVILALTMTVGDASGPMAALRQMGRLDAPTEIFIAAAVFLVCGCLNGTGSSTFSREGAQFWISKVIPVDPARQAFGKFLHSYLVAALGTVTGAVAMTAMFHLAWPRLAAAAALSLLAAVFLTCVNMAVDLARPLLAWTNPQKAIKQNLNVVIAMALDVGFLFGMVYLVRALRGAGLGGAALVGAIGAVAAALSAGSLLGLAKFARTRYPVIMV